MSFETWWLFVVAVFLLSGTPGPNMLHILSRSVEVGFRRSIAAMMGCLAAVILVLIASAAGLTALLLAMPGAFDVLRYMGMAYLFYLGLRTWFADTSSPVSETGEALIPAYPSAFRLFRAGFAISLSNPKLLLFSAAFLPQFINPATPQLPQLVILVTTFAALECFWYAMYALGGQSLARYLVKQSVKRWFNRITGGIFIGFGLALLKTRPA